MLYKNTANQFISVFAYLAASNVPATGFSSYITCGYSKDGAASGQLSDINPTEIGGGIYTFGVSANESNADHIIFVPLSSTGSIVLNPKEHYTRSTLPTVNATQIGGSTTAADNLVLDYNGVGYAKPNSSIGTTTNLTNKGGFQLATSGLDYVTATVPTGLATTFPAKIVQTHYRLYGRSRITATGLYTESGDGNSIYTTQLITDDGIKQIIDDAT